MNREGPTAVLLIAHGSRRAMANDDLRRLAARLESKGDYPIIEPAFLELAEPDIANGGHRCVERGARRVLIVPYLLAAGIHLHRDLTAARDELQRQHPGVAFRLGPVLGPHPLLDQLVEERVRQTDAAPDESMSESGQIPLTSLSQRATVHRPNVSTDGDERPGTTDVGHGPHTSETALRGVKE